MDDDFALEDTDRCEQLMVDVSRVEWKVLREDSEKTSPAFRVLGNDCRLTLRPGRYGCGCQLLLTVEPAAPTRCFGVMTMLRNFGIITRKSLVREQSQVIWSWSSDRMMILDEMMNFKISFSLYNVDPTAYPDPEVSPGRELMHPFAERERQNETGTRDQATSRMSYQNSSRCLQSLSIDLMQFKENHDVKLLCDGQTVLAHRSILSARSKVFKDMLQSEDSQDGCLEVKDMTLYGLRMLLHYIYSGKLLDRSVISFREKTASQLSRAAGKYAVPALEELCENFLKNHSFRNDSYCLQSLSADLHELYRDESDHDVKILCGGKSASAHRHILSARSSVFEELLSSQEGPSVEVDDMDFDVLQILLRYIYTGILPEMTKELATELIRAAGTYRIQALKDRCLGFLMEFLDRGNACDTLIFADSIDDMDYKYSVISYMIDELIPLDADIWPPFCDAHCKLANEVLNFYFSLALQI